MKNSEYVIKHPGNDISYKFSEGALRVKAVLMYEEDFIDSEGQPFTATKEFFEELRDNYTKYLRESIPEKVVGVIKRVIGKNVEPRYCPVLVDHDPTNALNKKGYVESLFIETFEGTSILFGELCIHDPGTIAKLKDGCLKEVSIGFGFDEDGNPEFREVSLIVRGAVAGAMVLMSKHTKKRKKAKISKLSQTFKTAMNHTHRKIAQYESELAALEQLKIEGPRTGKFLNRMVKEGHISPAAKKAIYYRLSETDKKTQNIVYDVLQTVKRYGTVKKGHQADIRNAMRYEEFIKANLAGEGVESMKESDKVKQAVSNILNNGDTSNSSKSTETDTQELLQNFNAALKNVQSNQKEVEKLREAETDRKATLEEVLLFMQKGKIKEAIKLAEKHCEDVKEFSEEAEDDEDMQAKDKEINLLKKKIKKLNTFNKEEMVNYMTKIIESSDEISFGCSNEDETGDYTKELKKKKKMKEDDDDDDKDLRKKKMKEDDDDDEDDDKDLRKKKMKEDDDDDDDKEDDKDYRKKKMKKKKMKEDDDDKDDKDDD